MKGTTPGWAAYYRIVARIPRGRVTTYGTIAALAGKPRGARQVGFALAALHDGEAAVPWHRVLGRRPGNHAGISMGDPVAADVQKGRLEKERVRFGPGGHVSLARYGWPEGEARPPRGRTKAR
jgi:methylated-DNA-protein-cysteine methyltransferase-like protein